jgi:hypothetical protein
MTGISSYSTTAANNVQANTGINWDEGMSPSAVNNSARANMADTRSAFNDLIWFKYGKGDQAYSPVYASGTSFTVAGADVTTTYHAGRRIKAVGSGTGTIYGTISSSSFSTDTTVNVAWDSGSLSNESLTIYISQIPLTGHPLPEEAGTFAPTLTGSGSNPTVTYVTQLGNYTKIGKRVFIDVEIVISGFTGGSGTLQLSNLPYTSNSTCARGAGTAAYNGLTVSGTVYSASVEILNNTATFNAAILSSTNGNYTNAAVSDMASNFGMRASFNYLTA